MFAKLICFWFCFGKLLKLQTMEIKCSNDICLLIFLFAYVVHFRSIFGKSWNFLTRQISYIYKPRRDWD